MNKFLFSVIFLLSLNSRAQNPEAKRTNIWYFGNGAGLDFSSGSPVAITDGALHSYEGGGSICDLEGNLLFYTDGDTVWDRLHNPMPNGTGLLGCAEYGSSAQNGLIIPKPGSENIYFIFTNDCGENLGAAGLRYSEVDMSLNSGFGDVTNKNVLMLQPAIEALAATKHANGVDYWVLGHEYDSNRFFAFNLTEDGVDSTAVISEIGYSVDDYIASISFSNAGDKLAMAYDIITQNDQLFQFDKEQGELSQMLLLNGVSKDIPTGSAYTASFSPDDSKLYYMVSGSYIYQYCVSGAFTEEAISATATMAAYHPDNTAFGQLQLGPDNKIYCASQFNDSISTIEFPNLYGGACGMQVRNLYLGGKQSLLGLPNFTNSFLYDSTLIPEGCDTINSVRNGPSEDVFLVFPNPIISAFQIQMSKYNKGVITLYNSIGQKVLISMFEGHKISVDVSSFPSGVFNLFVETDERKQFKKTIIIQNE